MMNKHYWSVEMWWAAYPPTNVEDIIAEANSMIDEYIKENPDCTEEDVREFSEIAWDAFCQLGEIGDIRAEYEDA